MMKEKKILLNCNEAIAWAALKAGVDFFSHYPGSPVNLVEPELKKLNRRFDSQIAFNDSLNEHIAALAAAGASFCGARSLIVMKHVGLNIAADPFNYIGYTGVKGGMVIIVGTDPGANSSTGEEDVHWFAPQFNFPLLEPTSVEECFTYVTESFDFSEKYNIPVMIFIPGRLAYNFSEIIVPLTFDKKKKDFYFQKDKDRYINVGSRAIHNHKLLLEKIDLIANEVSFSKRHFSHGSETGIITRGLTFAIVHEAINNLELNNTVELLNLNLVFPTENKIITEFISGKKEIIFIEDQDGFCENQIKMNFFNELQCKIYGKNIFKKYGEISIEDVEKFLTEKFNLNFTIPNQLDALNVPERLGTFCEGCPHTGSYFSIDEALKGTDGIIGGDIGCSSLPPFRADWLMCMNAGIGVSAGMAQVLKNQPIISTGGDGSFFHAGALSLLSAVRNKINLIHVVFDNRSIAMTGFQKSPTTDYFDHIKFLDSLGVDRIIEVFAYNPTDFTLKLKDELNKTGVRVFWVTGSCVRVGNDYIESRRHRLYPEIDATKCGTCSKCYTELACPAILNVSSDDSKELKIDLSACVRCGLCFEICPKSAITIHEN